MKKQFTFVLKFSMFFLCLLLGSSHLTLSAQAEEVNHSKTKPLAEYSRPDFEIIKKERLVRLHKDLVQNKKQINFLKEALSGELDMVTRIQRESKLLKLTQRYEDQRYLFIETITSINLSYAKKNLGQTTFLEDIKQILDPVLKTFKRFSEKPRQIQGFTEKMNSLEHRYTSALLAEKKLKIFLKKGDQKQLKWKVKESIQTTQTLTKKIKVELENLQFKILKMQQSEKSIVTTISTLILDFIKTKGKNLLLALLVFIFFFWVFKIGQAKLIDLVLIRMRGSEFDEVYKWVVRPTKIIYKVVTVLISFFMGILTLYVLNDWVLVTLILITLSALVWSSKQYMPVFLEQSKIVLNLGSVREGERVVFNGLPWKIESLGYYCKLTNPYLYGASLRINTKELLTSYSRIAGKEEPWFPTKKGDWVLVGNDYGYVELQTPEQVILKLIGGEVKYFTAKDFFELSPKNYSNGFCVEFVFGVDYAHQQNIFDTVLPQFESRVKKVLFKKHPDVEGHILLTKIDFLDAGASSLDLRFFMKCKGDIAYLKLELERSLKAEFVKVCNEKNYIIPFNQLSVHLNQVQNE